MLVSSFSTPLRILLLGSAALSLSACGSSGSYRVASVGSTGPGGQTGADGGNGTDGGTGSNGSDGSNGSTGSNGSDGSNGAGGSNGSNGSNGANGAAGTGTMAVSRVLVTAGNTVIGVSGKHNSLANSITGLAPGTTQITGTVTTVLRKTGQSLVDLGNGQSLILNGSGGRLGEAVRIDLASRTVTGAGSGSRLLGVSVLSPNVATGSLAAVNVGNNGQLLTLGNGSAASPVNGVLAPVNGVLAPVTGVVGGVTGGTSATGTTGHVTGVVGGLVGGLTRKPR